jgi:GNAT superfamily N-acetyltransferase
VARSSRYPTFYDYNVVRVEGEDPGLSADELIAVGEQQLAGADHLRFDIDDEGAGERLRTDFGRRGFRTPRLAWLRWNAPVPAKAPPVDEVGSDEVRSLRWAWVIEDNWEPNEERARSFMPVEAEVYDRRGGRWLVRRDEGGTPIAFVLLLVQDGDAEISLAYCAPEHRGAGIGTSLLLSAVREARGMDDVWIVADDEDRPKGLYERLGFAPAWISHEFTRLPPA